MSLDLLVVFALSFSLALIVAWSLFEPFFASNESQSIISEIRSEQALLELLEKREYLYRELEMLEQNLESAQVTDDVYQREKQDLYRSLTECLDQLEKHGEA